MSFRGRAVVIGLGIAGAAIAVLLARLGIDLIALDPGDGLAASLNNQKWKHSGLYYKLRGLAQRIWRAFRSMAPVEKKHLLNQDADFIAASQCVLDEKEETWNTEHWDIPHERMVCGDVPVGALGPPRALAGGIRTHDSVIDFPGVLEEVRNALVASDVFRSGTVERLILAGNRLRGVLYRTGADMVLVECDHCVLAAGAWAVGLLRGIGMTLPVQRWKSHVLTLKGEFVGRITAWLDEPGLTLVPYRGTTLVANARRTPVTKLANPRDCIPQEVETLKAQLVQVYPEADWKKLEVIEAHGCVKTEFSSSDCPHQDLVIFGKDFHGIEGLTVVFPGKASLAFTLAEMVAERLLG